MIWGIERSVVRNLELGARVVEENLKICTNRTLDLPRYEYRSRTYWIPWSARGFSRAPPTLDDLGIWGTSSIRI